MPEREIDPFAAYLRAVAAALRDLPAAEREEVLRELRAHLEDEAAGAGEPGDPATRAAIVGRFGPARRLGRALALARRGLTVEDRRRQMLFRLVRGAAGSVALLVAALFALLLLAGVPAATPEHLTEITGTYAWIDIPTTPERDLLIGLSDRAATFRVNDDRVPEVALAALLRDVRPGDRISLTVYGRFLPGDPAARGIVPVAAIRTEGATYLATPAGGGADAAPPHSGLVVALALLAAAACAWPEVRALIGGTRLTPAH